VPEDCPEVDVPWLCCELEDELPLCPPAVGSANAISADGRSIIIEAITATAMIPARFKNFISISPL
jgi:hypothetical protein